MQKKNFIYIGIGLAIIAIVIPLGLLSEYTESSPETFSELEFTYDEANLQLKNDLDALGISMSSPIILINQNSVKEHCTFFSEVIKQQQVEFCTSTEILDSEGNYLGNIHMVGSRNTPKVVLTVIQTNPIMENLDQIKQVFEVVVDDIICNCWEEFEPSGIETVSEWVNQQKEFHLSDTRPSSASFLELQEKNLQMELSTNTEGFLWKLLISG